MSITAIVPVKGKLSLLAWTISRLMDINYIDKVVLVGHEDEAYDIAKMMDVDWVHHPNFPLGMKFNAGWEHALKRHGTKYYMLVNSSDWFSANWIESMIPYLNDYDVVAKVDKHYYNIGRYSRRLMRWTGDQPLSSGLIMTKKMLERLDGRPFNDTMDMDLDWSLMDNIRSVGGRIGIDKNKNTKSMSVSFWKWNNSYRFDGLWNEMTHGDQMGDGKDFIRQHFNDAIDMTLW